MYWCTSSGAELQVICSDVWRPYLKVIAKKATQAVHVLDRFHIMAHFAKALDEVRSGEVSEPKAKGEDRVLTRGRRRCAVIRSMESACKAWSRRICIVRIGYFSEVFNHASSDALARFGRGDIRRQPQVMGGYRMTTGRALLVINRNSRGGQADLDAIKARLSQSGLGVKLVFPENRQSVTELIETQKQDCDRVIIGGGDGSLNAAAEALVANTLPLGILPLGTANDLARTLGIPLNPIHACEVIAKGRLHWIDLGCVNGHYFFNVAHIGFGVTLARQLSAEIKKHWGILGYGRAAFAALNKRSSFRAEIWDNGRIYKTRCLQIAVGNGRHFGGGLAVAHDARIDDHTLDVWSLEPFDLWELIVLLPAMLRGRHLEHRRVWHRRTESVEIRTRKRMPISADGEETTFTPAKFHVLPSAIPVYVPPHYETTAGTARHEVGQLKRDGAAGR